MKWEEKNEQDPLMAQESNLHDMQNFQNGGRRSPLSNHHDGLQQTGQEGEGSSPKPMTDRQLKGAMVAGGAACLLGGPIAVAAVGVAALAIAKPDSKNSKKVINVARAAGDKVADAGDRIVNESKNAAKVASNTVTKTTERVAHGTKTVAKAAGNKITHSSKQVVQKIDRAAKKVNQKTNSSIAEERIAAMG